MSKILHKVWKANIYLTQHSRAMSYCHKLGILNSFILSTICHRTLLFQTMNSARSNTLSLIYQWFKPSGYKDIRIKKYEFVALFFCLIQP